MDNFLYPNHPVRCIINGPSNVGKSVFLTKLISNNINEYDKIYIYPPSLIQDFNQKSNKCFSIYIIIPIIQSFINEEDFVEVFGEIVYKKDFEKSNTEIETYDSIEVLKFPQEYEDGGIIILDDVNEKERNDPRVQAMFKRSRHKFLSIFIISKDYYELPKKTIRTNGNIHNVIKQNNFRDVQNLYQDKACMDMTLFEFKYLTTTCWNEENQPLKNDVTQDKYTGQYRLGLNSIIVQTKSPF